MLNLQEAEKLSKYTEQINVKLSYEILFALDLIAEFEGVKRPELLRSWIRQKIQEVRKMRSFQDWKRNRPEDKE